MKYRTLGNSNVAVSEIGLGCWQLGADWGTVDEHDALKILENAGEHGVNFFDTADVYGAGRSEQLIGKFLRQSRSTVFVATKVGRQNYPGPYTQPLLRQHITDCSKRLNVDELDLVQLHCVPTDVMADGEIFEWLREFQRQGIIRNFGASVESMVEAALVVKQPGLTSLQVIFNLFRQKPLESLFGECESRGVGVIVRLPLASGMLAGKFDAQTQFAENDHRNYNRNGDAFNVGETFAGLPFEKGLELVEQIRPLVPTHLSMAQFAQRWILDHEAVTTVITGASRPEHVVDNASVSDLDALPDSMHRELASIYASSIHDHIRGVY